MAKTGATMSERIDNQIYDKAISENRGVIEILNNHGQVVQRFPVSTAVSIGRAYDNDIILDDPYVCEHHARMTLHNDQLLVDDLDSVNGVFIHVDRRGDHFRGKGISLASNDVFKIGHTQLRYRHLTQPLQKTKVDRHVPDAFWSLQSFKLILFAFIGAAIVFAVESVMAEMEVIDNMEVFSAVLSGIFMVLVWSGLWALFGKIMIGRLAFLTHVGIFSLAMLVLSLFTAVLTYLFYATGLDALYSNIAVLLTAAVVCWAVYAHLSYSTRLSSRAILVTCSLLTLAGLNWYLIGTQIVESEFSNTPQYEVLLKSPDYNFVEGDSLSDFFAQTDGMQEAIADAIGKDSE